MTQHRPSKYDYFSIVVVLGGIAYFVYKLIVDVAPALVWLKGVGRW